jgi:CBS domain-containing protein
VADFLKRHAPFDALAESDLLDLAGSGRVKFHESEEYVFHQGRPKGNFVWIVQQGRVELIEQLSERQQLRDVLGEGDMLGLERFAGNGTYLYSARTATDVILYAVNAALFEALISRYPALERYLAAHFSVAASSGFDRTSWLDADAPPLEFLRARLAAARREVFPSPPMIAAPASTRAAVRAMVQARSEVLAITAGGRPDGLPEAVLTASELALFCGRNPARLVREIRDASSTAELLPLLRLATRLVLDGLARPPDVEDCSCIASEVLAALAEACIRLADGEVAAAGFAPPALPYCWLTFGMAARGDLMRLVLPSLAAVYNDSGGACAPEASAYFAALAGQTAARFHACELDGPGAAWPEGALPCMPLSEWKRFYSETVRNPMGHDLYARREFFDLRALAGDRSVLEKLREHLLVELRDHDVLVPLLANDTLSHLPPLTFFRGMVLELDGGRRDSFDIAGSVVDPIADAARVFALARRRLSPAGTLERLEAAALDFPAAAPVFREAAAAFRVGLYHQTLAGSCRIEPSKLGRYDQRLLKTAFSSIQHLLELTTSTFIRAT